MLIGDVIDTKATSQDIVAAIAFEGIVLVRTSQVLDGEKRIALGIATAAKAGHQADVHTAADAI